MWSECAGRAPVGRAAHHPVGYGRLRRLDDRVGLPVLVALLVVTSEQLLLGMRTRVTWQLRCVRIQSAVVAWSLGSLALLVGMMECGQRPCRRGVGR